MKLFHKKNILFLSALMVLSLNTIMIFMWQFSYAENTDLIAPGGTISSETTVEAVKTFFGGTDAVNVIKNELSYKVIIKNNIVLKEPINITGANLTITTDGEDRIIKRDNTDTNGDGIIDFNESLFNITGGTLSFGEGDFNLGENNLTYDNLVTNYMKGSLIITGLNEITGGYINNTNGSSSVPNLTSVSSLVSSANSIVNIWGGVKITNNYSTNPCIQITNNSTFNMYGGSIEKCVINSDTSLGGAGIFGNNSTFNFNDGSIINNEVVGTSAKSSAIYLSNNSIMNVNNIEIINNTTSSIAIDNSEVNMNGGKIYNNEENDIVLVQNANLTLNNGYLGNILSNEIGNIININNGIINSLPNVCTINYSNELTHYEVTIPDGSSLTNSDYVKIYDTNTDELIAYYEGPVTNDISSLKFYLPSGNYKAHINHNKSYYFSVNDANNTVTPSGINAIDESFGSNSDGTINGITLSQEISFDNIDYIEMPSYVSEPNTIPSGIYYIREAGQTDYVEINVRGTYEAPGGTLSSTSSILNVENIFGGTDLVNVTKNGSNYIVTLKSNILLTGQIKINSGNYIIISDGGNYTIKRDITSFTNDMFYITGGSLTFGSSNIINEDANAIKYLFEDEEIISNINAEIPERSISYIRKTQVLTGIQNKMIGLITLDGGSIIENGYINNVDNGPSTTDAVSSGVILNIESGSAFLNTNVILKNNYNGGTRINGSAINISENGILKMYGGLITKCVRNNASNTFGSSIYNNGNAYIYSGEIAYNETNSNLEGKGTIYNNKNLYITDIYLHNNWSKTTGSGIYNTIGALTNFYNGVNNNNISFNYKNTTNNTYTNIIQNDVYLENGVNSFNVTNGTIGHININGNNVVKVTEANIENININSEHNEVILYPLVKLTNNLNIEPNTLNDVVTSISDNLNFLNLTNKSITTFNSKSTLKISFYQKYINDNFNRYISFSNLLPQNTSIILRRVIGNVINTYYYKNSSDVSANTPIYLTEFKLLGTNTSLIESSLLNTVETIELIIDFQYNDIIQTGKITYYCGNSYSSTTYEIDDSDEFNISDFTIDNQGTIIGGNITANPSLYSNFYYEKDPVVILSLSKNDTNIPFVITNETNTYSPSGSIVNVVSNTLDNLIIKNIDGSFLSEGSYTLTTSLSMTKDIRERKYSTLDGIILTKSFDFVITNKTEYGLSLTMDNTRVLNINEENNGTFNFNINKTNLENGNYDIKVYKKLGEFNYSNESENGWTVSESNSVLTVSAPLTSQEGTYKMVISYIINETSVVQKEYNIIIKK